MAKNEKIIYSISIPMIIEITNLISTVAKITDIAYRDLSRCDFFLNGFTTINNFINAYTHSDTPIDLFIEYDINDDMRYSFDIFLDKYIEKYQKNVAHLEKCLAVDKDD